MGYITSNNYNSHTLTWNADPQSDVFPIHYDGLDFVAIDIQYKHNNRFVYVDATACYTTSRVKFKIPIFGISEEMLNDLGFNVREIAHPTDSTVEMFVRIIGTIGMWDKGLQKLGVRPVENKKSHEDEIQNLKQQLKEKDSIISDLKDIIQELKDDIESFKSMNQEC